MGNRKTFNIAYPDNDSALTLYQDVIDIIKPSYVASYDEINHGDCFGAGLTDIMIGLNQIKIENKDFDFGIWLDSWEHESGLVGLDFDCFYKDGWYPEIFYRAVKDSEIFKFLSHNGFVMTSECGDFFLFASCELRAKVIQDYMSQELWRYISDIQVICDDEHGDETSHAVGYKVLTKKISDNLYAVTFEIDYDE